MACTVIDRGFVVLLTASGALLRLSATLLPAAFDTAQTNKKTEERKENPVVARLRKLEARVAQCAKTVEDRQADFEIENTKRYDVDPNDEVCLTHARKC